MKETGNFQLNQWEMSDRIQMEDFNADNRKIDEALEGNRRTLAEHTEAIVLANSSHGNCEIWHGSYVGTATAASITFPFAPAFVCIYGARFMAFFVRGVDQYRYLALNSPNESSASWSEDGKTLTLPSSHSDGHMNSKGDTYYVVGIGEKA